jgi:hypothetical protein
MNRALCLGLVLVAVAGCQLPAERIAVKPLPADGGPVPYGELIQRVRSQATAATEAFYTDKWADLEEAAKGVEQASRFLPKATEVPARHQADLAKLAEDLGKEAEQLRDAAKAKDDKRTNEVLQRLHLKVRALRPES